MLLGSHFEFPILRVVSFWQDMLAGRFGLIGVQVLNSSLNPLVPQLSLQCEVLIQGPKMKGAGRMALSPSCKINTHLCTLGQRHSLPLPLLLKSPCSCQDPSCNLHLSPLTPFLSSSERAGVCRRRSCRTSNRSIGKDRFLQGRLKHQLDNVSLIMLFIKAHELFSQWIGLDWIQLRKLVLLEHLAVLTKA